MEVGILGLASSGKTTLFNLLTGNSGQTAGGRGSLVRRGMAQVPDPRLDRLSAMYTPRRHTPAVVHYMEVPGIPEEHRQDSALNVPELRTADVLLVVLRGFDSPEIPHPMGAVDPKRDLKYVEEEFLLQDQMVVERRLERLQRDLRKRRLPELAAQHDLLTRCLDLLEAQRPLRGEDWSASELKLLRGFTFLSLKPLLVVLNVSESQIGSEPLVSEDWSAWVGRRQVALTRVCATLEGELAEMDEADSREFMAELGIRDRALDRIIRESYNLLGLISFFTVGEDECRAWSIPNRTPAVEAGGVIHSDIRRGFIRAEVVPEMELVAAGSLAACRQRGALRLEGKTHIVQDGDVVHFRFNV